MSRTPGPTRRRVVLAGSTGLLAAALGASGLTPTATAGTTTLDLGVRTLPEVRTLTVLAPGVELTQIVRGLNPAAKDQIEKTTSGPWRVAVLTIDPRTAKGALRATYGADLARTETVSTLTASAKALAGVNSSFFTYTKSPTYPGDPVGLGLYDGHLLSDPAATSTEVDVLVDARRNTVRFGRLSWSGRVRNKKTKVALALAHLNSPPVVPKGCTKLEDPRTCRRPGDVVRVDRAFGRSTPKGAGAEVVLGRDGCVDATAKKRGRKLASGQTSLQATGRQSRTLLTLARGKACFTTSITLRDAKHEVVKQRKGLYGVTGRYRLVAGGKVVVPRRTSKNATFFDRHPRTLIGTTASGTIALVTIDGSQRSSVGATLKEAARVAVSLGLTDAVNLDGGGSTTMVAAGQLANVPSHGDERKVGDALVWVGRT